jgi:hypothetical protein
MQIYQGDARHDGGRSKHLWNVGKFLQDHTAQQPRRQPSSCPNDVFTVQLIFKNQVFHWVKNALEVQQYSIQTHV